jgi:hypothetical protein
MRCLTQQLLHGASRVTAVDVMQSDQCAVSRNSSCMVPLVLQPSMSCRVTNALSHGNSSCMVPLVFMTSDNNIVHWARPMEVL